MVVTLAHGVLGNHSEDWGKSFAGGVDDGKRARTPRADVRHIIVERKAIPG